MDVERSTRRRRAVLCVPATEPAKIRKAFDSAADEVMVDLEDAVAIESKAAGREQVAALPGRTSGSVAVRVNAASTPWFEADVAACVGNPAVDSIVMPKAEGPHDVHRLDTLIASDRRDLGIQVLIESARGLVELHAISRASGRLESLILGYADLSASLGRANTAPWEFAQDMLLVAARAGGLQAIDGPHLSIAADETFIRRVRKSCEAGFDGTWVIHPQQITAARAGFAPDEQSVADAREIIAVMEAAQRNGSGAVSWRGRMLDEALVLAARRLLSRADS